MTILETLVITFIGMASGFAMGWMYRDVQWEDDDDYDVDGWR